VTEIEAIVEPANVADDLGWGAWPESVTFMGIDPPVLSRSASYLSVSFTDVQITAISYDYSLVW